MDNYKRLIEKVLEVGHSKKDRTSVGTLSLMGNSLSFQNLKQDFPLLQLRRINPSNIIAELLWFIQPKWIRKDGSLNNKDLVDSLDCKIWQPWAPFSNNMGPIYGAQWHRWKGASTEYNQLKEVIRLLKEEPHSRRIIINMWNVGELDKMVLPPCPCFLQFYVSGNSLSLMIYQRSADLIIGVPHDIGVYSLLLIVIAEMVNLRPHRVQFTYGDVHIYNNHIEIAETLLDTKTPSNKVRFFLNKIITLYEELDLLKPEDFIFKNYNSELPILKGTINV